MYISLHEKIAYLFAEKLLLWTTRGCHLRMPMGDNIPGRGQSGREGKNVCPLTSVSITKDGPGIKREEGEAGRK